MITIQKNYGDGVWHNWATPDGTFEDAIEEVRGYCLGPGVMFRVLGHSGLVEATWGPNPVAPPEPVCTPEAPSCDVHGVYNPCPPLPDVAEVDVERTTYVGLARAFANAVETLKPEVGDTMHVKIKLGRIRVSVDRA